MIDWNTNIDWKDNVTYKNYVPLWQGLVSKAEQQSANIDRVVSEKIFNTLMSSLLKILSKLDLRTKRRSYQDEKGNDQEFFFCDPNIDLCPVRPADFHIFFNVVDLYRDIFWTNYPLEFFEEWLNEFCVTMLQYVIQYPLVSGFLKLLQYGISTADQLQYFEKNLLHSYSLKTKLSCFLKSLIDKCQRMPGELQISCLELSLKFPTSFYSEYLMEMATVFELALELGKSVTRLADVAIGCLESICLTYQTNLEKLTDFYKKVFPRLDSYLRSKSPSTEVTFVTIPVKKGNCLRRRKLLRSTETELCKIQKKIIDIRKFAER